MDIQLVSIFSTTVSVLNRQEQADTSVTNTRPKTLHRTVHSTYRRSMSLGFLATYCWTRSCRRVFMTSVKYSSLSCRAMVSRLAT